MDGLDKENTYVLLIGSSDYPNWQAMNIPNVRVNIRELESLLADPFYCGIPRERIRSVVDQNLEDSNVAIQEFFDSVQSPRATVILYYSGHGLQSVKAMDDLFLATRNIRERAFEASSIKISSLRGMFSECIAGKKILLLDCCYAGKIAKGFMSDDSSETISKLSEFEGTYIMAASSEFERARFDPDDPGSPTKFTGKFLDIVKNGIPTGDEYFTLNSIYWQIQQSFSHQSGAPKPIQVSKDNIGIFPLFKNKKFVRTAKDVEAWDTAEAKNTVYGYNAFMEAFPDSEYAEQAKKRIGDLEDDTAWGKATGRDSIGGYREYLSYHVKYSDKARQRLNELAAIEKENESWQSALRENKIDAFNQYLAVYPNGRYAAEAAMKRSLLRAAGGPQAPTVPSKPFIKKYWIAFTSLLVVTAVIIIILSLPKGEEQHSVVKDVRTEPVSSKADSTAVPTTVRLSDDLLSQIKEFNNAATFQFNDYFDQILGKINNAPKDFKQDLDEVKKFMENCRNTRPKK